MRVRNGFVLAMSVVGMMAAGVRADEGITKDGGFTTGTITRVTPKSVELTTVSGGNSWSRDHVISMRSEKPVTVVAADGKEHQAFVVPSEDWGGWHESSEGSAVAAKRGVVKPTTVAVALP